MARFFDVSLYREEAEADGPAKRSEAIEARSEEIEEVSHTGNKRTGQAKAGAPQTATTEGRSVLWLRRQ